MVAILIGSAVSAAILGFAGLVIWREVMRHWSAIGAALRGEPAHVAFQPAGTPQRASIVPVRAPRRVQSARRPQLALAA